MATPASVLSATISDTRTPTLLPPHSASTPIAATVGRAVTPSTDSTTVAENTATPALPATAAPTDAPAPSDTNPSPTLVEPQTVIDSPMLIRLQATGSPGRLLPQLTALAAVQTGQFQPLYVAVAQGGTPETVLAVIRAADAPQFRDSGVDYTQIDANADTAQYYSVTLRTQDDVKTLQGLDETWQQIAKVGDHVFFRVRLPAFVGYGTLAGLHIEKLPPRIALPGLTAACPCAALAYTTFSALPPAPRPPDASLSDTITQITAADLQNVDTQIVQNAVRSFGMLNTRYTGTKGSVYMAERLYTYFFALGLHVEFDSFVEMGLGTVVVNVVAEQPGTKSGADAAPIVITAHYDSLGERNLKGDMTPTLPAYGANDNGTGIAGMLEIARLLTAYHFTQPVRYLATGGEEQGMLGSQYYTAHHLHPDIPKANINIDSFGYNPSGTDDWIVLGFNHYGADLKDAIVGYAQKYAISLRLEVRRGEAFFRSDDYWFDKHGIDSVVMTDSFALQSPNNHTPNDTIANVNFTTARKVVQLALVTAAEYAQQ